MLTSYNKSYRSVVYAKHGIVPDMAVGILVDFVINSDTGVFEAAWVKTGEGIRLISFQSILEWNEDEIYLENESDLLVEKDFPRLEKILQREVPILGNKVFMKKTKTYLGKVTDFAFDTISPRILTITVKKGFWLWGASRIIHHRKISKITKEGIFILETGLKVASEKSVVKVPKKFRSSTETIQKRDEV